jgi:hypothetical protein
MSHENFPAPQLKQAPARGQFVRAHNGSGCKVETLASHACGGLHAKRFLFISEKVSTRGFALYNHRMATALPADSVGSFSAGATLLGKHYAAAVAA